MSVDTTTLNKKDLQENTETNQTEGLDNFDWAAWEATCPKNLRKANTSFNVPKGYKIMSHEPYAQQLLEIMLEHEGRSMPQMKISTGGIYDGTIYSVNPEWVTVDIGYRQMVYVNLLREEASVRDLLQPEAQVKVQILETEDSSPRKFVLGSISAGQKTAVVNDIMSTIETGGSAYEGHVTSMIPGGGYIVTIQGVECFMPGSLAGINKLADFESIVDTKLYVVPVSFSQKRGTIVVSHREYLKALIPGKIEELKANLTAEKTGKVTGSAKYGVFVEFDGCLTGMIHVNDLDPETAKRHKAREIQPDEDITFKIKEIVTNEKIILTQVEYKPKVDAWDGIEDKIKVPAEIVGTIKSTKDYGVFVEVEKGLTGLLHVSELPDTIDIKSLNAGDKITVTVTRIDSATRKIFLKL